ncbi:MAG: hypothetical protein IBJ03_02615 [Gemmatimonadaceae bacterium]|nr:hypothetical protein [Gemmatimonadaceae bacterium]
MLTNRTFDAPEWTSTEEFTSISSMRVLSDGRILVADVGEDALVLLDSNGTRLSTVGRKGQGPGEYMDGRILSAMPNDSTRLVDPTLRRVSVFDSKLQFVRLDSLPEGIAGHVGNRVAFASNGDVLAETFPNFPEPAKHVFLLHWSAAKGAVDTIGSLAARQFGAGVIRRGNGPPSVMFQIVPYSPSDDWVLMPDGEVVARRSEQHTIEWIGRSDSTKVIRATAAPSIPVSDAERNEEVQAIRDLMPKFKPVYVAQSMMTGSDHELWMQRTAADSLSRSDWDVTDVRNGSTSTISFPKGYRLLLVTSNAIYTVHGDQDDIERVSRFSRR